MARPMNAALRPLTSAQQRRRVTALTRLWARHDRLERQILLMERHFSDAELRRLGAAAGSDR